MLNYSTTCRPTPFVQMQTNHGRQCHMDAPPICCILIWKQMSQKSRMEHLQDRLTAHMRNMLNCQTTCDSTLLFQTKTKHGYQWHKDAPLLCCISLWKKMSRKSLVEHPLVCLTAYTGNMLTCWTRCGSRLLFLKETNYGCQCHLDAPLFCCISIWKKMSRKSLIEHPLVRLTAYMRNMLNWSTTGGSTLLFRKETNYGFQEHIDAP